jgi:DNA-binding MarR family transcriptional regulator
LKPFVSSGVNDAGFGLVEQYDNVLDRRERLIRLTAKGNGIVGQICKAFARSS